MASIADLSKFNKEAHVVTRENLAQIDELKSKRASYIAAYSAIIRDVREGFNSETALQDHPAIAALGADHPAIRMYGGYKLKALKEYVDILLTLFEETVPAAAYETSEEYDFEGSDVVTKERVFDLSLSGGGGKIGGGMSIGTQKEVTQSLTFGMKKSVAYTSRV